jgi:hypothetical protein
MHDELRQRLQALQKGAGMEEDPGALPLGVAEIDAALGGRHARLMRLMRDMPELAADLDVPAPGSAHAPTRRVG